MAKKYTVYSDGRVAQPFKLTEDIWFYASRGKFNFVVHDAPRPLGPANAMQFSVPTRTIRKALALVDSVKR